MTETREDVPSTADKLRQEAATAAQVRALSNNPDVVALRVEKVRSFVDSLVWVGIFLGLAFTMVNVQTFAASGAVTGSLPWLAAWLLDPMVSLVLVAVLRAEQITARYQVHVGTWAHRTKWFAFLATYAMNTWRSWTRVDVAGVVLHSVPPVLVFLAAETAPVLRDRLTEAVARAAAPAFTGAPAETVHETREEAPSRPVVQRRKPKAKPGRKLRADYLAEARAAWTPGIEVTPAWVRSVCPEISRGTSKNVADELRAEVVSAPTDEPREEAA
ncbi:hypothetical protein FHX82_002101 [Amycolatopsis bartoniae]|uniref:DUF2637 domain-containing protein n=1 Tax=Amycolatopsis bartoniae TaxID=941986 RepID=A0A8H9MCS5_9PSEU|nr:hypothetical protein [Amycolatopsis bartoniae]MBB2935081.1 hypothetical protein [Amycolatopsis bartoniae]TVT02557.1 hypothetical protein FNH07_27145 [Amycolatopsis bartoniae]GHF74208.1 hypothetical protein GCM10017566_54990 [Amycolatopsis bartoniae]